MMENRELNKLNPVYIREIMVPDREDEISLIDLTLVLIKRKKNLLGVFLLVTLLGLAVALVIPEKYTFTGTISIGTQLVDGEVQAFESPETVLAKVRHSYIPYVLQQYNQTHPADDGQYKITVNAPKSSNILLIEIEGKESDKSLYKTLLNSVSEAIINDHQRIFTALKNNFSVQLETSKNQLSQLGKSNSDQARAGELRIDIDGFRSQIANLRATSQVSPPMMSEEPTSISGKLIVIISAFTGLFLGVFGAFFAEFVEKVREKQRQLG